MKTARPSSKTAPAAQDRKPPKRASGKPHQPPPGQRVTPGDKVEEASHESFPASDAPSFAGDGSGRSGPYRPAGEHPDQVDDKRPQTRPDKRPPTHSGGRISRE